MAGGRPVSQPRGPLLSFGPVSGQDPQKPGSETAEVDEGWADEEQPVPAPAPEPKPIEAKPKARHSVKPLPPLVAPTPPLVLEEDQIEFEADSVARDSLPTLRHPNPLVFDRVPESQTPPPAKPKKNR